MNLSQIISDPLDLNLLDKWQRDYPICDRPFRVIADQLGLDEADVIARLTRMREAGRITRIGATCAPNTVSASTLAAVAAPPDCLEKVADVIATFAGVNHSYQRENRLNLWFVATGPDRAHVDATLNGIATATGLEVLDLRLKRPFNIDLGFSMAGTDKPRPVTRAADTSVMKAGDRAILQHLTEGLAIVSRPYSDLGAHLNRPESEVIDRILTLQVAGIISRLGVIVRHRALGWRANAMVVWDLSSDRIDTAAPPLAALPGVTLCYERRPVPGVWPYRLYNMIHARSRDEAKTVLASARALPGLRDVAHKVLFSTRCFKQSGALISLQTGSAA